VESATPSPIEETLAELADSDRTLQSSSLADLADLTPEEIEFFAEAWAAIEPGRRQECMGRLVALAEDNANLDFDSIFRHCLGDQDARVRSKAIEGLYESEDTSLISLLIRLLEQDSSEEVQAAAATALGKFVMLAELEKLRSSHKSRIGEALLSITGDKGRPMETRRRALEAMAPLSLPPVKKAIMEAYRSRAPGLRASAIYAMGKNCDPCWLAMLLRELESSDAGVRYEACGACGELGETEAVPYLVGLVADPDVEVQTAAIQALGKIGGAEAKECLEECLDSTSEVICQAAEQALRQLEVEEEPFSFKFETFDT